MHLFRLSLFQILLFIPCCNISYAAAEKPVHKAEKKRVCHQCHIVFDSRDSQHRKCMHSCRQKAYYCSRKCWKIDWNASHRENCQNKKPHTKTNCSKCRAGYAFLERLAALEKEYGAVDQKFQHKLKRYKDVDSFIQQKRKRKQPQGKRSKNTIHINSSLPPHYRNGMAYFHDIMDSTEKLDQKLQKLKNELDEKVNILSDIALSHPNQKEERRCSGSFLKLDAFKKNTLMTRYVALRTKIAASIGFIGYNYFHRIIWEPHFETKMHSEQPCIKTLERVRTNFHQALMGIKKLSPLKEDDYTTLRSSIEEQLEVVDAEKKRLTESYCPQNNFGPLPCHVSGTHSPSLKSAMA